MKKLISLACLIGISVQSFSQTQAKIMYYNILNFGQNDTDRLDELRVILDYYQPDILVVNELESDAGGNNILSQALNYSGENYEFAPFVNGPDTDNGFFYDPDMFTLIGTDVISTDLRDINMYKVRHIENQDTVELELYSCHLKASSGSAEEQQREEEARDLKAYLGDISQRENVFVGGDFNFYNAQEGGFRVIVDEIGMKDPLGQTQPWVDWHNNGSYAAYHSQSPRTTQFGGGSNGGMDDRFDFIFMSNDVIQGLNDAVYIFDSYKALGNDGEHFNGAITDLPVNQLYPESLITAIHDMSDHLPVVAAIELFPENPQSINELEPLDFNIFQNNYEIIATAKVSSSFCAEFEVYDTTGGLVISQKENFIQGINSLKLDTSDWSKGIYFLVEKSTGTRTSFAIQ